MPPKVRWACEMGCTPSEFADVLRRAFADWQLWQAKGGGWRLASPDDRLRVEIETASAEPRRLGSLILPVLEVSLAVAAPDPDASAAFLARFERSFRKGGG